MMRVDLAKKPVSTRSLSPEMVALTVRCAIQLRSGTYSNSNVASGSQGG